MRYMFMIYLDERASDARSDAERAAGIAAHAPYIELLRRNRQYIAGEALGSTRSARTLRSAGGKPVATQGPFAESREQFGGFYVIEASDLDEAIALATRCPALATVGVGIEIRPILAPATGEPATGGTHLLAVYRDGDADADVRHADWPRYLEQLRAAEQLACAGVLAPPGSATSIRLRDGDAVLTDGPFAAQREQLGGYIVVRARDLDAAVELAAACPEAGRHAIEIRPIRTAGG